MTDNLSRLIAGAFEAFADHILLEEEDGTRWLYRDLAGEAARLAGALARAGVVPGDRVIAQTEKCPEALALYFACLQAGAVYVPLNTEYTEAERAYFIADAVPRLVVCRPADEALFARLAIQHPGLHVLSLGPKRSGTLHRSAAAAAPPPVVDDDDIAAILYTSGTTGKPKGAMLTQGNLGSNGKALAALWGFSPDDVLLHALPIFHVHGLFVAVHCAVLSGARMLFLPRFAADRILALMPRATVLMGVPTFYTRLIAHPGLTPAAAQAMRLFVAGSAPLSADTFRAFAARTGHRVLERYGMTETGILTSNPYGSERRPGSVGLPLAGVSVRIADPETGQALTPGEVGSVEVHGANVFKGYWRNPEKTAAEFRPDGYFITGDLGFIDPDGYVHLVGRAKDLIISGGFNVYPKEVEAALDDLPTVAEAAVIGVPHPDLGEAVVAVVTTAGPDFDAAQARTALRESLAGFKIPKEILSVPELPRNTMGKVQKNVLRDRYKMLFTR